MKQSIGQARRGSRVCDTVAEGELLSSVLGRRGLMLTKANAPGAVPAIPLQAYGVAGASRSGLALVLMCALFLASGFKIARLEVGGLLIHPYLFLVPILLIAGLASGRRLPRALVLSGSSFLFWYLITTLGGPSWAGRSSTSPAGTATIRRS